MDRWLAGLKGTLNLWDAHRVKVYNKEFRAEHLIGFSARVNSMLTLIQKLAHLCLKPLIALFDFPIVPAELTTLVNKLFEYIQAGTGILNFFVPFDVIRPAIDVFLAVWAVEHAYQLVLWVLRKVPILSIK